MLEVNVREMSTQNVLSARRLMKDSNCLRESLKEFLQSPVRLDEEDVCVNQQKIPKTSRQLRSDEEKEQQIQVKRDKIISGRRKAFEISHHKRLEEVEKQSQKMWDEEERLRRWKTEKARKAIASPRIEKDNHVLETIIEERNKYYLSTNCEGQIIQKSSVKAHRALPPEIRAVSQAREPLVSWGIR